jgi:drug/metabolite transporter (DMT)-like permease
MLQKSPNDVAVANLRLGGAGTTLRRSVITFLYVCAPLLFAGNMVAARWMNGILPPVTMAFGRWLVVVILLSPFVWLRLRGTVADLGGMRLVRLGILGGALSVAPQYAAATYTSAGHIALIFAATPLLVTLIERAVWKVPVSGRVLLGVGLD